MQVRAGTSPAPGQEDAPYFAGNDCKEKQDGKAVEPEQGEDDFFRRQDWSEIGQDKESRRGRLHRERDGSDADQA